MNHLSKDIQWRWLPPHEWNRLNAICEREDWDLPNPNTAAARVGEIDGEIVAVGFLQLVAFIGPAYIDPELRGRSICREQMQELLRAAKGQGQFHGAYLKTILPEVKHIAEAAGFKESEESFFTLDFKEAK